MARLKEHYDATVRPALIKKFGYKSPMQAPHVDKVVLNMGVGEAVADSKLLQSAVQEMTTIAGQKPVITRAKKSIAAFKLREGMAVGVKVTFPLPSTVKVPSPDTV